MGGFNSVLQAYMQSQQLAQQKEQFKQQHDLAQKQLEETAKFHQAEIDRMQNEFNLNKTVTAQQLRNAYIEHIAGGIEQPPGNAIPTGQQSQIQTQQVPGSYDPNQPPSVQNLPTTQTQLTSTPITNQGYKYNLSPEDLGGLAANLSPSERELNITSPEERARISANAIYAQEAAKEAALQPGRERIEGLKTTSAFNIEQMRAQERRYAADQTRAGRENAARMQADSRIRAAQIGTGANADDLAGAAEDASSGLVNLKDIPTKLRAHAESIIRNSGRIPYGKDAGDKLKAMSQVEGVFQDMKDAAALLPPNMGADQVANWLKTHSPIVTDLQNRMSQIQARGPSVVRNVLGVQNRVNQTELKNLSNAMVTGKMTQEQAFDNISRLQRDSWGRMYNENLGGMPTEQKVAVIQGIGGGIDKLRDADINYKGQVLPVVIRQGTSDYMFNMNTGKYENIERFK